jgi:outer membrane lipoprotein SlyB
MTRLAFAAPLAVLAVFLAGCASQGPATPASVAVTPIEQPYRAGTGVVQAVTPAPGPIASGPNTSARNPAATAETSLQRLRIRMDDGRMMYVDTPSRDFAPGARVLLSDANEIRRQ